MVLVESERGLSVSHAVPTLQTAGLSSSVFMLARDLDSEDYDTRANVVV